MGQGFDNEESIGAGEGEAERPSSEQIAMLLREAQRRHVIIRSLFGTVGALIVVAAAATLIFSLWLPVLQVQRGSMAPTLNDGDVVIFVTSGQVRRGDVIAFYQGSQVLVKRVIAVGGDYVDISDNGTVMLNYELLAEPYVEEPDAGERTAELPAEVPDGQFFVLGDHRQTSLDSRSSDIGMVRRDQVIGKALMRIWPVGGLGALR